MKCPTCNGVGKLPAGRDLRRLRKRANLTITQVADRMGVGKSYLSEIETGKKGFTAAQAQAFERAVEQLLKD